MKQVELFYWFEPAKSPRHKPRRTTYRLSREEAARRLAPGSWPDELSRQVVDQPETPEEQQAAFKGWAGPRGIYEPGPK